jgi:DedD protein
MNKGWSSFMDRRVKERLVGASILVALVVLIVPELLSGPKHAVIAPQATPAGSDQPMRTVTVDLATSKATADSEEAAASAAATSAAAATGAATTAAASSPGMSPGASVDRPPHDTVPHDTATGAAGAAGASSALPPGTAPSTAPPAAPPAAPPGGTLESGALPLKSALHHGWEAQVGSFAARENAEKLERQLRAQGFSPVLSATGAGKSLRYRVRLGPVADRGAAQNLITQLAGAGHTATLVPP